MRIGSHESARRRGSAGALLPVILVGFSLSALVTPAARGADGLDSSATAPSYAPAEGRYVDPGLDRLLRLPRGLEWDAGPVGGATEAEWRRRFQENREAKVSAERDLAKAKKELEGMIGQGGGWNVVAPGQTDVSNTPVSFKLREEMRRSREQIETSTKERRKLEIEADLAQVPASWREPLGADAGRR